MSPLILNIDTATEIATISISQENSVLAFDTSNNQKDHASFLQPAIKALLKKLELPINKLSAISVSAGPGSYTGLRVGMASAKGLCYALNIPLIAINTLQIIGLSAINKLKDAQSWYCPLIDARRMEVFTAVYDKDLNEIVKPCSMILSSEAFKELLKQNKICFTGSGILKLKTTLTNQNAIFIDNEIMPEAMAQLSYINFIKSNFASVSYFSPLYIKEFYIIPSNREI